MPSTAGSALLKIIYLLSATVVERVEREDAIIIGKLRWMNSASSFSTNVALVLSRREIRLTRVACAVVLQAEAAASALPVSSIAESTGGSTRSC